jgi:CRISPR/Cas system-associated endoribonuclease Cas2
MEHRYYKGIKVNAFGIPVSGQSKNFKKKQINLGFPKKLNSIRQRDIYNFSFSTPFADNSPKNLIVMYDIPDSLKKERDWFRRHLIKFGYTMIQRSVWVGPSPLPKQFLKYLKEIKIGDKLKTFKLAKPYNSSISAIV